MAVTAPIGTKNTFSGQYLPTYDFQYYNSLLFYETKWSGTITYYLDSTWSTSEKAVFRSVLSEFSSVAKITFQETTNRALANWIETQRAQPPGFAGQHQFPHQSMSNGTVQQITGQYDPNVFTGLKPGSFAWTAIAHEIGHALGLTHTHLGYDREDLGYSFAQFDNFPGVLRQPGAGQYSHGDNNLNQGIYSLMSYNFGWEKVQNPQGRGLVDYGYNYGPMAFDIAALQFAYGRNDTYKAGNDTYTLPDANAAGTGWKSIWDSGGIDTLIYNGTRSATLDLRDANISNSVFGGGMPSYASGIYGGYTIARDAQIERATGGSGNDKITGNELANLLMGRGGNDTIYGGDNYGLIKTQAYSYLSDGVATNGSRAKAVDLQLITLVNSNNERVGFSTLFDSDVFESTRIPHITVNGIGAGALDFFKLTILNAGSVVRMDIDGAYSAGGGIDTVVQIQDVNGKVIASNDDSVLIDGVADQGSSSTRDAFLAATIATPGTYYLVVGVFGSGGASAPSVIPSGATYKLNVSVSGENDQTGRDVLNGGDGNDTLYGQNGIDTLTGGTGKDNFVFNTIPSFLTNRDSITDFSSADDTIKLENSIFTELGTATGTLTSTKFYAGTAAHDASDRIIYNKSNGYLYYDADGDGAGAQVVFAILSNKPTITYADFVII